MGRLLGDTEAVGPPFSGLLTLRALCLTQERFVSPRGKKKFEVRSKNTSAACMFTTYDTAALPKNLRSSQVVVLHLSETVSLNVIRYICWRITCHPYSSHNCEE